jgi:hypothetical protein
MWSPSKFDEVRILTNPLNAIGTIQDIHPGLFDVKYQIWIHGTGRSGMYKRDEFELTPWKEVSTNVGKPGGWHVEGHKWVRD